MDQTPETPTASNPANHDNPDHGSNNENAKRKRQPRNSACQGCASMKMKCVPGPEPGKCERCHRMARDCMPTVPKPRKRRNESDGEINSPQGVPLHSAPESVTKPPRTPTHRTNQDVLEPRRLSNDALLNKHDITHNDSESFRLLLLTGLDLSESHFVLLRGVDYSRVQNSLLVFRHFTDRFPFAVIRRDADGINMATSRPATTLAICAIAACSQPQLQARLLQALHMAFSHRMYSGGEPTVDFANAMMLHLAWRHHYMQHSRIYQELALLAGAVSDLGYYDPISEPEDPTVAAEKDLLFLGSYYLCCGLSVITFGRPSPLSWNQSLRQRAQRFAYSGGQGSERALISMIELVHITEEFVDDMRYAEGLKPELLAASIELHDKAVLHRLRALKREYPELGGSLSFTAATLHVHRHSLSTSTIPDTSLIIQCAVMIKEYIDDLLGRQPAVLHQMPITDWSSLLNTLVLMASFSKPTASSSGWEAGALSSMLQPEAVLDSVTKHMASATANDPLLPRNDSLLDKFRQHCEDVRRKIDLEKSGTVRLPHDSTSASLGQFRAVNQPLSAMPSAAIDRMPLQSGGQGNVLDDSFWNELRTGR